MPSLRQLWINLSSSLWFVPLGLVAVSIVLAALLTTADARFGEAWTERYPVLFGVGTDGARGMLSAIAGSMMTVASLTFSLTIAILAAASAQYTSRLVRNFMRDRINQFVLGYFVSLFAYCLVVLRTIRGGADGQFVPHLAVLAGLVFALASIAVLIYFIHHIAESIQASTILERITTETLGAIEEQFPSDQAMSSGAASETPPSLPIGSSWRRVTPGRFGYVQSVNISELVSAATEMGTMVRVVADVGGFVSHEGTLCEVALAEPMKDGLAARLAGAFSLGTVRTVEQDVGFGVRQLVDIALKALSPGINDSTTGVMCVQHLAVLLESLAAREIPHWHWDDSGIVRVMVSSRTFESLAALCLSQIRLSAAGNPAVLSALLDAIEVAGNRTGDRARRKALGVHASLLADLAEESLLQPSDRAPIADRARVLAASLEPPLGEQ